MDSPSCARFNEEGTIMSYVTVTELPGTMASREQLQRMVNRYHFASKYCGGKDVLELACGAGIGLGLLKECSRSLIAGDIDAEILEVARRNNSVECRVMDAQELPCEDKSFDVVILFEAIYYLKEPGRFVGECKRVLRDGGYVIVSNPNKDLPDFNPSPFSYMYFNPPEFKRLFEPFGFTVECFGDAPVVSDGLKSKMMTMAKKSAVAFGLMPKTMAGKQWLKRVVFGKLEEMPPCVTAIALEPQALRDLDPNAPDHRHKVILCLASLSRNSRRV
jgi:SAM-dependent methyltransferase